MRLVAGILTRECIGCSYVTAQYFRRLRAIQPLEDHYISGQQILLHLGNGEEVRRSRTSCTLLSKAAFSRAALLGIRLREYASSARAMG